ncbi:MAG: cation-translocating P-type ATPase family protein [Bacteroidales bacterium]|nr:cation-translocating P-type ATPase family protein [Bacteroidales bacterium]
MHREFHPTDSPFRSQSHTTLYLLTGILGVLLIADLWPLLASWLASLGLTLPTWSSREFWGFRFALIAAVLGGARTLYGSLERLSEGKLGADLAVAIAVIAAILIGEPLVAAEVVFIALFGECLEAWTFDRTQRAVQGLNDLFPTRCWVLRDGEEVRTFTTDLIVGDTIIVKPGGRVPADGVIVDGRSAVDTSALTGESLPVEKGIGDAILAGSLVQNGSLTLRAERVAQQTVAGQMIALTATALQDKGTAERQADRLARYFLPAVLLLAGMTFLMHFYWQSGSPIGPDGAVLSRGAAARLAIYPMLAVLVVACPCPLVLATPAAVLAALGRLAGTGVLVKSGAVLERLATVQGIAFDKTGTLTEGQLEVGDIRPIGSTDANVLLTIAATAEQHSEHPIAQALLATPSVRESPLEPFTEFLAHPGGGVAVETHSGRKITVGNPRWLQEQGFTISPEVAAILAECDATGQTAVLVGQDAELLGVIGIRDRLRAEAVGVLDDLAALGLHPITVLTGDRAAAAQAIIARVPTPVQLHSELLPAQKADWLTTAGPTVFIGDGVNDAPALARATVGIAIGSGTDIAAEAGDVVMMGDPLRPLPLLIQLSRETAKIIRQNILWFGFGVNLFGVLLAGWLVPLLAPMLAPSAEWFEKSPLIGVLYHQIGSLAVLLNSLRLLAFGRTASNPTLLALREAAQSVDHWAVRLHPEEWIHAISHHGKLVAASVAALALVAWCCSSVVTINIDEVGVVQRFGAVQDTISPGLHIRWPWPIETVTKLKPEAIHTVPIGYRLLSAERAEQLRRANREQEKLRQSAADLPRDPALTWASSHADTVQRLTDESLIITGDGNLIEVLATVRYTVSDPIRYLFGCPDPDALIRTETEAILRELAAGMPFLDLLTVNRATFEQLATAKLQERLQSAAPGGLGVRLAELTLHDLHPPQDVVASYHQVAEAIQRRDRTINAAEAEALRRHQRAEEVAIRLVRRAEADAAAQIADATAKRDAFLAWAQSRQTLPAAVEATLTGTPDAAQRREALLAVHRFLTDFRLSLEAAVAVLRRRDKILIDADTVPGRRHLFLADPEIFRGPAATFPRTPPNPLLERP